MQTLSVVNERCYFGDAGDSVASSLACMWMIIFSVISQLLATPWTVSLQSPLSMGFPRQEYCSGLPFPSPEDLPDPGIEPTSPGSLGLQENSLPSEPPGKPLVWQRCYCLGKVSFE